MKEDHLIEHMENDIYAIYSPEKCGLIFFRENTRKNITDFLEKDNTPNPEKNDLYNSMLKERFLKEEGQCVCEKKAHRPVRTLYFSLTYNCNLNCTYCLCHQSFAKTRKVKSMSREVAEKAISKFMEMSLENEEREVVLYGGEPVLYPDLLKWIYNKVREYEEQIALKRKIIPARFILCTNGTRITPEFAKFLKTSGIYPAVSIDGPPEFHDSMRRYYGSERGSFEDTVKGYRVLEDHQIRPGVTTAFGSHNAPMITEIIEYFADNFNPKTIALNTMLDYEIGSHNPYVPSREDISQRLWGGFLKARDKGMYLVKNVMDNRIRPFVERIPKKWGCTASGGRLGVLPEGKIVPCMALSHKYGCALENVDDVDSFCPKELLNAGPYQNPRCHQCPAKATCGGGCPAVTILQHKPAGSRDDDYCYASLYFLKQMIRLLWDSCKSEAQEKLSHDTHFVPSDEDRKKIYGNIPVENKVFDFQYAGDYLDDVIREGV